MIDQKRADQLVREHHALVGCRVCNGPAVLEPKRSATPVRTLCRESTLVERSCYPKRNTRLCTLHLKRERGLMR